MVTNVPDDQEVGDQDEMDIQEKDGLKTKQEQEAKTERNKNDLGGYWWPPSYSTWTSS